MDFSVVCFKLYVISVHNAKLLGLYSTFFPNFLMFLPSHMDFLAFILDMTGRERVQSSNWQSGHDWLIHYEL